MRYVLRLQPAHRPLIWRAYYDQLRLQRDLAYSRIISLCLETVLFGVLAVTFVSCLKKFLNQSPKRSNTTKKRDTFLFSTLKSMFYCNATVCSEIQRI